MCLCPGKINAVILNEFCICDDKLHLGLWIQALMDSANSKCRCKVKKVETEKKKKSNAYNKPKASYFLFRMPVIFAFKYLWVSSWMCICETNIHILILDLNLCVVCCYWNIHDDDVSGVLDAHFIGLLSLDYDNFPVCSVPNDGKWKIRNKKKNSI